MPKHPLPQAQQLHQRIPQPQQQRNIFPHLTLPPSTDGLIDTMNLPPNVASIQQPNQTFMTPKSALLPQPNLNKYAHMHNVSKT